MFLVRRVCGKRTTFVLAQIIFNSLVHLGSENLNIKYEDIVNLQKIGKNVYISYMTTDSLNMAVYDIDTSGKLKSRVWGKTIKADR